MYTLINATVHRYMSSFPPRCFTCGKVISHLHDDYLKRLVEEDSDSILDDLKIGRPCCRRMFATHVDIDRFAALYPTYPGRIQTIGPKHKIPEEEEESAEEVDDEESEEMEEDQEEIEEDQEEVEEDQEEIEEDQEEMEDSEIEEDEEDSED